MKTNPFKPGEKVAVYRDHQPYRFVGTIRYKVGDLVMCVSDEYGSMILAHHMCCRRIVKVIAQKKVLRCL